MSLTLEPVLVATNGHDEEGRLVFAHGRLVGLVVRLSALHEELAGQWFFEAGFGRLGTPNHPVFADLAAAQAWIERRLSAIASVAGAARP
jgi:hypothetical protein